MTRLPAFLSGSDFTSADLWHLVKPLVRQVQNEEAVLIVDDSIEEKPYTDESELICWHWGPLPGTQCQGRQLPHLSLQNQDVALPVAFQLIRKSVLDDR
jgi:hypothetical protein